MFDSKQEPKLIIFTTCKPFIDDDAWRQEQAIRSWLELKGIEIKIIVLGNDFGTKDVCEKYNLIHEPIIKSIEGVPYLNDMFIIANKYANKEDVMLWTNSDMIFFNDIIESIKNFKKQFPYEDNYALFGSRIDWANPKILDNFNHFFQNIKINNGSVTDVLHTDSSHHECYLHAPCGIDYVIHSKSTYENRIDPNLVIAGTGHDMILVGTAIKKDFLTCDISESCKVIHQNHGYKFKIYGHGGNIPECKKLIENNQKCTGHKSTITNSKYKMNKNFDIIKK